MTEQNEQKTEGNQIQNQIENEIEGEKKEGAGGEGNHDAPTSKKNLSVEEQIAFLKKPPSE